jgi:hypothetical protein
MKPVPKSNYFFCLLLLISASCKKFIEINPPITQLVTASVFDNNTSATSAVTAIYTQMFNNGESYSISQANGFLSDELTNYSTYNVFDQYYLNSMVAVNGPGEWTNAYNYIYEANAIIEALTNNKALNTIVINQLKGEAEFIRAFWHFYLVNCYGDIPLVVTTNYASNAIISRTPKVKVYQQIIEDLNDAENLLNSNYVDASDTTITNQRVRPTKWAAAALLAKVYLYTGDYADAATQATLVINNSTLFSLVSIDSVFLANSNEAIWQLYTPLPTSYYTIDGYSYILSTAPSSGTFNCSTISPQLLGSFEAGDRRFTDWLDSISFPGQTYYFPYKYKVSSPNNTSNITEYTMVLRLGEQYLIRAEAEAKAGQLEVAANDLNKIRLRAGLDSINLTTQSALLSTIFHERQVELFTEWGNRWFDLIRTGNVAQVMGPPGNVCAIKNQNQASWNSVDTLYPIPQNDRKVDPNLSQNLGY